MGGPTMADGILQAKKDILVDTQRMVGRPPAQQQAKPGSANSYENGRGDKGENQGNANQEGIQNDRYSNIPPKTNTGI